MGFAMQATTEWKRGHIWDILVTIQPHSLGTGDKCTPLVSEFCLERYSSVLSSVTRLQRFKITSFASRDHSSISAPPPPFLSAVHDKKYFLRAFTDSSGARAPQAPSGSTLNAGKGQNFRNNTIVIGLSNQVPVIRCAGA